MALRDQPYLPLYIQDIMTDEKLNECSAATHGIYIKGIMCLMHKSEQYGKILLKQKDKQTDNQIKNFALKCDKHLPYTVEEIESAIAELVSEGVLHIEDDSLCQKRMIKDNSISELRAKSGSKGGTKNKDFAKAKVQPKHEAKTEANSEYENENENEIGNEKVLKIKESVEKLEVYTEIFGDKRFVTDLSMNNKGKDINHAFEECWLYHSATPSPPQHVWEWKQKLITWLSIKQTNGNIKSNKGTSSSARPQEFRDADYDGGLGKRGSNR